MIPVIPLLLLGDSVDLRHSPLPGASLLVPPEGPAKLVPQIPSTREDFVADFVVLGWLRPPAMPGESCVMHGMLAKLGISA